MTPIEDALILHEENVHRINEAIAQAGGMPDFYEVRAKYTLREFMHVLAASGIELKLEHTKPLTKEA